MSNMADAAKKFKFYTILQAEPTCTDEELKRAYRKRALKLHPDKNKSFDQDEFLALKEAYNFLNDSLRRKFYNRHGDAGHHFLNSNLKGAPSLGSDTFEGRLLLPILTHPSKLNYISFYIGSMAVLIILFFWALDWKLAGWKRSWYTVFTFIWIPMLSLSVVFLLAAAVVVYVFLLFMSRANEPETHREAERERKAMKIRITSITITLTKYFIWLIAAIWASITLAQSLESNVPWRASFKPLFWAACASLVLSLVNYFVSLPTYSTSLYKRLKLAKLLWDEFWKCLLSVMFILQMDTVSLVISYVLITSALTASYIFGVKKINEDLCIKEGKLDRRADPLMTANQRAAFQSMARWSKFALFSVNTFLGIQIALIALHCEFNWPKTWTWTFFMVVSTAFMQVFAFMIVLPLMLYGMDRSLPDVGKSPLRTGASSDSVVIDLPTRRPLIYCFGYALSALQPRLTYRKK